MKTTKLMAGLLLAALFTQGGQAIAEDGQICNECKRTARLVLQSDMSGARADYYVSVARASATVDEEERIEMLQEARADYRETVVTSRGSYDVRLNLCRILDECQYVPDIDPENFLSPEETSVSPNLYYPLVIGRKHIYEADTAEGLERIEVLVTDETREIMGVECMVIRDTVWLAGEIIEDTQDWYAQDIEGNVWYFGELTFEFEDGQITGVEGSWEAGEEGAKPGIIMLANPQVGDAYRQELLVGDAEDAGQVLSITESVDVAYGPLYENCVQTHDINPHSPFEIEHKYFAPGVGFVLEVKPEEDEMLELVAIEME